MIVIVDRVCSNGIDTDYVHTFEMSKQTFEELLVHFTIKCNDTVSNPSIPAEPSVDGGIFNARLRLGMALLFECDNPGPNT